MSLQSRSGGGVGCRRLGRRAHSSPGAAVGEALLAVEVAGLVAAVEVGGGRVGWGGWWGEWRWRGWWRRWRWRGRWGWWGWWWEGRRRGGDAAACPGEAEHGVEFDSVRGDTRLAVEDIEEADTADRGCPGQLGERGGRRRAAGGDKRAPRLLHLRRRAARGALRAGKCWELDDHRQRRLAGLGDHQVDVVVVLELHLDQHGAHLEAGCLDPSDPASRADTGGSGQLAKRPHR